VKISDGIIVTRGVYKWSTILFTNSHTYTWQYFPSMIVYVLILTVVIRKTAMFRWYCVVRWTEAGSSSEFSVNITRRRYMQENINLHIFPISLWNTNLAVQWPQWLFKEKHTSFNRIAYNFIISFLSSTPHFLFLRVTLKKPNYTVGARGSVAGWGTTVQAGRSRSRFPMR
jgi:hypothetical protein